MSQNKKDKKANKQEEPLSKKEKRKKFWKNRIVDVVLVVAIFWVATAWQTRNLIKNKEAAPDFQLTSITGDSIQLYNDSKQKTIIYFFAPWCTICALSSQSINALSKEKDQEKYRILAIGLDYEDVTELQTFAQDHKLTVPVLIGDRSVQEAYKIGSFPTFYLLDKNNRVKNKTVGYTTAVGLELRSF